MATSPTEEQQPTDAVSAYLAACEPLNAKPNKQVLRLYSSVVPQLLRVLDLGDNYLGDVGVECLSASLPLFTELRVLSLADNGLASRGVATLCIAIDTGKIPLQLLDLHRNPGVTRVAGQALLNTIGRSQTLAWINLTGTRVTKYFETRIQKHAAQHYAAATDDERAAIETSVIGLVCRASTPELQLRASPEIPANGATPASRFFQNVAFDEAVAASDCDDGETSVLSEAMMRPMAPSNSDVVLHSVLPDFGSVAADDDGAFTITRMPSRNRTVYGPATPTKFQVASDVSDIFKHIEMYEPQEMTLPVMFVFPGKVDYHPAVHVPDPFVTPSMPPRIQPEESGDDAAEEAAEGEQQRSNSSMYWNFFHTAGENSSSSAAAASSTSVEALPVAERQRRYELQRAEDAICGNTMLLKTGMGRTTPLSGNCSPMAQLPLSELVLNPAWLPSQPTRGLQVDEYNATHKL
jgi:hypothetical protein